MKILVTGGTVFVSKNIAEYFLNKGHEVYVLNRNTKPQIIGVKLINCDRRKIDGRLKTYKFDAVIDVTAYKDEDINTLLDNLDGFDSYIMISSSAVYPETLKQPFKESDKCGVNKFWESYGVNKINAENALLKRVKNSYVIRPPYLYGEYNNIYREAFVFDCALQKLPFYLPKNGEMNLQFFYIKDLCRFIDLIIKKKPINKVFNVGNKPITVKEWVRVCYKVAGVNAEFVSVDKSIDQRNYFPFYDYEYTLDTSLQNYLMPDLTPLEIGLKNSFNRYVKNNFQVNKKNYLDFINKYLK